MQLLWSVAHGLERTSKRMAGAIGVTGPQRLVLRVVGLFPGVSAGHLAAILRVHPSTLTGVLQRLSADGLLTRTNDPRDRRRAVLRLTASGSRANMRRAATVESAIDATLRSVSRADQRATRRLLERLAHQLSPEETAARPRRRRAGGRA